MKLNRITWSIIFVIMAQFGTAIVPPLRQLMWVFNFLALLLLPYQYLAGLKFIFPRASVYAYFMLIAVNLGLIIAGIFFPHGQSLQAIIGNPVFLGFHVVPLFAVLALSDRIYQAMFRSFKYVILFSFLVGIAFKAISLSQGCVYFFIVFFPYIKIRKYRYFFSTMVILLGLMTSMLFGMRMVFLAVLFFIASIVTLRLMPSFEGFRKRARIATFLLIFTPFTCFIIAITTGYSVFRISEEFQFLADSDQGSNDTRTFVWEETLVDLVNNDAILFGKGMAGTIKTRLPSFVDETIVKGQRLFVEPAFLELIRRGGLILTMLNFIILVWAVWYACLYSKNRFLLLACMALSFFFLLSFIGHFAMLSFEYLTYWVLIGLCLSKKANSYNDDQIYELIHTGKLQSKHGDS